MGALGILQGIAGIGSDVGRGAQQIREGRQAEQVAEAERQLRELQTKMAQLQFTQASQPQPIGSPIQLGGKWHQLVRDPSTGKMSLQSFDLPIDTGQYGGAAERLITGVKDPERQQRLRDLWDAHTAEGDYKGGLTALQQELGRYESQTAAEKRAEDARAAADKRMKEFQKQAWDRLKERERFSGIEQNQRLEQQRQLSGVRYRAGQNAGTVEGAITAVNTILENKNILTNLLKSSKIQLTRDPQGAFQSLVAREVKLSPQEAAVATAFAHLTESINLLRGPMGATGFRGPEAFGRLQAQAGNPLANPAVTVGILKYTLHALKTTQRMNKQVLGSQLFEDITAPTEGDETTEPLDIYPIEEPKEPQ